MAGKELKIKIRIKRQTFKTCAFICLAIFTAKAKEKEISLEKISAPETGQTNFYINIDNSDRIENNNLQDASSNAQSQSQSTSISHANAKVHSVIKIFREQQFQETFSLYKRNTQTRALALNSFCQEYATDHRWEISFGLITGMYAYAWITLLYLGYQVLRHDSWSCWKDNLPFDVLRAIPEQELGKELVFAAQQKYQKPDTLDDLLTPLIIFLRDVDQEPAYFQRFIAWHTWLKRLFISRLFPHQVQLKEQAEDKLKRLRYLKDIFIRWITDYKLAVDTKL